MTLAPLRFTPYRKVVLVVVPLLFLFAVFSVVMTIADTQKAYMIPLSLALLSVTLVCAGQLHEIEELEERLNETSDALVSLRRKYNRAIAEVEELERKVTLRVVDRSH